MIIFLPRYALQCKARYCDACRPSVCLESGLDCLSVTLVGHAHATTFHNWFSCFSYLSSQNRPLGLWNSLPPHILQSQTLSSFRRHLKTHYFQSAYSAPLAPIPNDSDSLLRLWSYINHLLTYLLTMQPFGSWHCIWEEEHRGPGTRL